MNGIINSHSRSTFRDNGIIYGEDGSTTIRINQKDRDCYQEGDDGQDEDDSFSGSAFELDDGYHHQANQITNVDQSQSFNNKNTNVYKEYGGNNRIISNYKLDGKGLRTENINLMKNNDFSSTKNLRDEWKDHHYRRDYHYSIKGNERETNPNEINRLRVGVRCRPPFEDEADPFTGVFEPCIHMLPHKLQDRKNEKAFGFVKVLKEESSKQKEFLFDYVFPPSVSQSTVYSDMCRPIVKDVLRGFNGAILAYGQTGTGKTHTMGILKSIDFQKVYKQKKQSRTNENRISNHDEEIEGQEKINSTRKMKQNEKEKKLCIDDIEVFDTAGVVPVALYDIFKWQHEGKWQREDESQFFTKNSSQGNNRKYDAIEISMSFLQIYKETIFDLLPSPNDEPPSTNPNPFNINEITSNPKQYDFIGSRKSFDQSKNDSSFWKETSYIDKYDDEQEKREKKGRQLQNRPVGLTIREDPIRGCYVSGLNEYVVKNLEEAVALLNFGLRRRAMAPTHLNTTSSRSHTLLYITIDRKRKENDLSSNFSRKHPEYDAGVLTSSSFNSPSASFMNSSFTKQNLTVSGKRCISKLCLVDLAGSERLSKTNYLPTHLQKMSTHAQRLAEARSINISLSALGNVVAALSDSQNSNSSNSEAYRSSQSINDSTLQQFSAIPHYIPYRTSKLTRVLQDFLNGKSSTSLIATVSPSLMNVSESMSTLLFANRCMQVKITPQLRQETLLYHSSQHKAGGFYNLVPNSKIDTNSMSFLVSPSKRNILHLKSSSSPATSEDSTSKAQNRIKQSHGMQRMRGKKSSLGLLDSPVLSPANQTDRIQEKKLSTHNMKNILRQTKKIDQVLEDKDQLIANLYKQLSAQLQDTENLSTDSCPTNLEQQSTRDSRSGRDWIEKGNTYNDDNSSNLNRKKKNQSSRQPRIAGPNASSTMVMIDKATLDKFIHKGKYYRTKSKELQRKVSILQAKEEEHKKEEKRQISERKLEKEGWKIVLQHLLETNVKLNEEVKSLKEQQVKSGETKKTNSELLSAPHENNGKKINLTSAMSDPLSPTATVDISAFVQQNLNSIEGKLSQVHRKDNDQSMGNGSNIEIFNKDIQSNINGTESSEEEDSFEHDYNKYGYYLRQPENENNAIEVDLLLDENTSIDYSDEEVPETENWDEVVDDDANDQEENDKIENRKAQRGKQKGNTDHRRDDLQQDTVSSPLLKSNSKSKSNSTAVNLASLNISNISLVPPMSQYSASTSTKGSTFRRKNRKYTVREGRGGLQRNSTSDDTSISSDHRLQEIDTRELHPNILVDESFDNKEESDEYAESIGSVDSNEYDEFEEVDLEQSGKIEASFANQEESDGHGSKNRIQTTSQRKSNDIQKGSSSDKNDNSKIYKILTKVQNISAEEFEKLPEEGQRIVLKLKAKLEKASKPEANGTV